MTFLSRTLRLLAPALLQLATETGTERSIITKLIVVALTAASGKRGSELLSARKHA